MLDFEEHDQKERQMLFVATTDRMNTYGFLVKAKLACGRRRVNPTLLPVQKVMHDFFFSISTVWSVVRLTPSAQVCFWKERAPFLLYILPVTAKSGSGSMFHLLHTQICPSEVSVQSQGRLLSSFLSD